MNQNNSVHSLIENDCYAINLYNRLFQYKMANKRVLDLSRGVGEVVISSLLLYSRLSVRREPKYEGEEGKRGTPTLTSTSDSK